MSTNKSLVRDSQQKTLFTPQLDRYAIKIKRNLIMRILIALLLTCLSVNSSFASIYHGVFNGYVTNLSGEPAPFSDGDLFTLSFEVDTTSGSPHLVELDINGVTGTFGNTYIEIYSGSSQDAFTMLSALDSPFGIFDGYTESNLSFNFIGEPGLFPASGLAQPFSFPNINLNTQLGSFEAGYAYSGDLQFVYGDYLSGPLPIAPVPLPATVWLFCSGMLGLIGFARRKNV